MQLPSIIRIGTRKSLLAVAQAQIVRQKLMDSYPGLAVELVTMLTSGDRNTDRSLADIGGKGLFTKELEESLENGSIDIAVHSLKDMETHLRPGMCIAAVLPREDPRDVLIAAPSMTIATLPPNAQVGTSSLRRAAQLKILRPDLQIVLFRGNVNTRLTKLKNGEADAILLALAGLRRIGMEKEATEILDTVRFIPAVGQGTIAIECKEGDAKLRDMLQPLHHIPTYHATLAERSLLATLDGSCRTPIGGYARMEQGQLVLDALIAKADGSLHIKTSRSGDAKDAVCMGEDAGRELLARGGNACLG